MILTSPLQIFGKPSHIGQHSKDIYQQLINLRYNIIFDAFVLNSCMKKGSFPGSSTYLDISELLLKDFYPYFEPDVPLLQQDECSESMTPFQSSFILEGIDVMDNQESEDSLFLGIDYIDFEELGLGTNYRDHSLKHKINSKAPQSRYREPHHYLILDNQLEMILADNEEDYEISEEMYLNDVEDSSFESNFDSYQQQGNQNPTFREDNCVEEEELLGKTQNANIQNLPSQWFKFNPKAKIIQNLKQIPINTNTQTELILDQILEALSPFIFDHQKYYIEQCIGQLQGDPEKLIETLIVGVSQNFKKNIKGLSFEKRRAKLFKYMEKKKRRIWKKKVNYDCRKKVADGRLRIKGKFVTHEQACRELGCKKEETSADEVKSILGRSKSDQSFS